MSLPVDILGFGAMSIDDLIYVDRPFREGKGRLIRRQTAFGGNVATALVAAQRLGAATGFVGWLAEAEDTDPCIADLRAHGVDLTSAPRHPDARAIRSTITVDGNGERFIVYDDDVLLGTDPDLPDTAFGSARFLLIDAYAMHSLPVVRRAAKRGLSVISDLEWQAGEATNELIELSDHLIVPLAFGRAQTGREDPVEVLEALWSANRTGLVLTDGARGAFVRQATEAQPWHVPAIPVQAVDTTGAGDCFHGAYAAALSRGLAPLAATRRASAAAALAVTGYGGREALPDAAACNAFLTVHLAVPQPL